MAVTSARRLQEWGKCLSRAQLKDLAEAIRFHPDGYTRTRVARTDEAEVLLMCWLPGQATKVHDHGEIQARVFIVAGCARETEFVQSGDRIVPDRRRLLRAGNEFRERPGSIHRVECVGPEPLITLHLNSPPLVMMHDYATVAPTVR